MLSCNVFSQIPTFEKTESYTRLRVNQNQNLNAVMILILRRSRGEGGLGAGYHPFKVFLRFFQEYLLLAHAVFSSCLPILETYVGNV